ncbi:MAG: hypothetical protein K8L91_15400 [Anaerolineae bacterium]|nr:hypothetical protein [Anaerolineae bacterium]
MGFSPPYVWFRLQQFFEKGMGKGFSEGLTSPPDPLARWRGGVENGVLKPLSTLERSWGEVVFPVFASKINHGAEAAGLKSGKTTSLSPCPHLVDIDLVAGKFYSSARLQFLIYF